MMLKKFGRFWGFCGVLTLLLLLVSGTPAHAGGGAKAASNGFDKFCTSWMGKLRQREKVNIQSIRWSQKKGTTSGEFTGYSQSPVSCSVKSTGNSKSPFLGTLVYHEILYRKAGPSSKKAKKSEPQEVERVEVTELFRFNGFSWEW